MPLRPTPLRLMLARPEKFGKKLSRKLQKGDFRTVPAEEMLPKSCVITVINRAIIPSTVLSQKTSGKRYLGIL